MAIRIRSNGDLVCAAMTKPQEGDTYLNDNIHYYLAVLTNSIRVSKTHEKDALWFWNIDKSLLEHYADINFYKFFGNND